MKKTKCYILYACDEHHSSESKILLGVFDLVSFAKKYAIEHSKETKEGEIQTEDRKDLYQANHTSGRKQNYIVISEEYNQIYKKRFYEKDKKP